MKIISAVALAAIFGVGATRAQAADAGAPKAEAAPAAAGAKKIDWEHMTVPEKKKYMKVTVLPEMKKAFQTYDAKAYKKFTCATCHGDGATDGKFKMPNAKLPKLPAPGNRDAFMELNKKKPEAVKFMGSVVKPKMAELLGLAEWSPTNMTGFGCFQCHTSEK
jgi:hypothetical protein